MIIVKDVYSIDPVFLQSLERVPSCELCTGKRKYFIKLVCFNILIDTNFFYGHIGSGSNSILQSLSTSGTCVEQEERNLNWGEELNLGSKN